MSARDAQTTEERVQLLVAERPDLVPHLKRCCELGSEGYYDDVPPDALAELVRRGFLVLSPSPST